MATLLAVLSTPRTGGFTASLWRAAVEAAEAEGVEVDAVSLADFSFGPCRSCYSCIRSSKHVCPLPDDMGRAGRGRLFARVTKANALPPSAARATRGCSISRPKVSASGPSPCACGMSGRCRPMCLI